ncbi:MAG: ABC transporter, partial [Gammaproteobacteria bacterium]
MITATQRKTPGKLRIMKEVSVYFRPYRLRVAAAFLALTVAALATLALPVAVRRIVDQGFFAEQARFI